VLAPSVVLGPGPERDPRRGGGRDDDQQLVAQSVAPDGTVTPLGGRPVTLPVSDLARTLAATAVPGRSVATEVTVGGDRYRQLTTALGGARGALQVAVDVDQSRRVLGGLAWQIAGVSLAVLLAAAGAGWLLARRITRRLVRLAAIAEDDQSSTVALAQSRPRGVDVATYFVTSLMNVANGSI
jgi:two-component system sensor histidine kinase MprB